MISSSLPLGPGISRDLLELRARGADLQRQLASGQKSETYAGLGSDRSKSLSIRESISALEAYSSSIELAGARINAVNTNLERLRDIAAETRTDSLLSEFNPINGSQSELQVGAANGLNESIALLNFEIGGHYFFAGRAGDTKPVVSDDIMLNGTGSQAGLVQVIDERRQADLGADGRGRLVVPAAVGPLVAFNEDVAGSPFGFKIGDVHSSLSGTTVNGPTGSPANVDVTFSATLPQDGETITVHFDLPDGTQTEFTLTARTNGPIGPGEFAAAVDADTTAANFQAALITEIEQSAERSLRAASAVEAADNFFDYDSTTSPQRVDGPPFDSATGLVDGTTADTVHWYQGDNGPGSARDTALVKADTGLTVSYGNRASEEPFVTTVKNLALLAAEHFDPADPDTNERYLELRDRTGKALGYLDGVQSIEDVIGELGFKSDTLNKTAERHASSRNIALTFLSDIEQADPYEVSAQLLQIQTQLDASYQVTSMLANLSLVNYL